MATSKELIKAIKQGAEVRIMIAGEPTGGLVKYSPRHTGDREAWAYQEGRHVYRYTAARCAAVFPPAEVPAEEPMNVETKNPGSSFAEAVAVAIEKRNAGGDETCGCVNRGSAEGEHASDCIAGLNETAPADKRVTPEVVQALRTLRGDGKYHGMTRPFRDAFNILDNAGIFSAIDEASDYGTVPSPDAKPQVSTCTCPIGAGPVWGRDHLNGCPGDPAAASTCTCPGGTWNGQQHLSTCPDAAVLVECTCGPGVAAQFGHGSKCPVAASVLEARETYRRKAVPEVRPEAPVSECTCPPSYAANDYHAPGCPGDPAAASTCTCGSAGPEFVPAGHYRDCPESMPHTAADTIRTAADNLRKAIGLKY